MCLTNSPNRTYPFDEEARSWGIQEKQTCDGKTQYFIPFYIPRRQLPKYRQKIPLVIYHTYKSHWVDHDMYLNIRQTLEFNPEYDYYFYTDLECIAYLTKDYGPQYSAAFQNLTPGAFKADFWRYCILLQYGGVYLDVDLVSHRPLRDVIASDGVLNQTDSSENALSQTDSSENGRVEPDFISVIDLPLASIYQAMIGAVPQHPFLKSSLYLCFENLQKQDYGEEILDITGPTMMGKAVNMALGRNIHHSFQEGDFKHQNKTYRFMTNNGKQVTWKKQPVFSLKYETYDNSNENSYGMIYFRREVWKQRHEFSQVHLVILLGIFGLIIVLSLIFILYRAWARKK